MKKQLIIIGIIVILFTVGLSGCNEDNNTVQLDEEKIIGKWIYSVSVSGNIVSITYNFSSNKMLQMIKLENGKVNTIDATWNITDEKLFIILENETITNDYKFSNNNKTLTLNDGIGIMIFTKQ